MAVSEELRDKIEHIANLPTLPQIASRLMTIINHPEASAADVAEIVGQDVSLCAKILRLANSAFYGIPRGVTNINAAVVLLGFKVINTMVLSLTVFDMFPARPHSMVFDRKAFWRHCLRCGIISKLLAQRIPDATFDPEEAFCAGLLHDIGKIVMEQYLHDDFVSTLQHAVANGTSFCAAEAALLPYSHTGVADWLVSRWELPDVLYFPIVYHHAPLSAPAAHVCHYADYLCYDPDIAEPHSPPQPPLCPASLDTLGLSDDSIASVKQALPEELAKMDFFLDILEGK